MSETMRRIEDLVPADIEAERLLQLAPALWRQWGVVVSLEQIDDGEQRVALQALAGAFGKALYGPREASAQR